MLDRHDKFVEFFFLFSKKTVNVSSFIYLVLTNQFKRGCKFQPLSGSPAKSGPLDYRTKINFPSFFVREKGLAHIYKKAIYYIPVSCFCFATSQNCILTELRLPTVIRKVKFTDFVRRATSPKMQLAEFRFHTNSKIHSLL